MTPDELRVLDNLITGLIAGTTFVAVAFSPIARAIGRRIMHGKTLAPGSEPLIDSRTDDLSGEVAALRQALYEQQERLDFAERVIAQVRDKPAIPGPGPR